MNVMYNINLSITISVELTADDNQPIQDYGIRTIIAPDLSTWIVGLTRGSGILTVRVKFCSNKNGCPYKFILLVLHTRRGASAEVTSTAHDIMLDFLRDIHSVDVCFVFESDETCLNVGLWTHRTILSRYKEFENATHMANNSMSLSSKDIGDLTIGESDGSSPSTLVQADDIFGPLMISAEKFTLATLCVLLRYIYTGEIKHAISMTGSTLILEGIASKFKNFVRWRPLGPDSHWNFKDVIWEELLLASDYYEITELRSRVRKK